MAFKMRHASKGRPSAPHLHRQKMSIAGKTSYQHAHKMAFPSTPASADGGGMGSGGAPPAPPELGGAPPDMAGGEAGPPAPPEE